MSDTNVGMGEDWQALIERRLRLARAENDKLRAEVKRLNTVRAEVQDACRFNHDTAMRLREERDQLRAENERLKADGRTFMDRYMDMEEEVERLRPMQISDRNWYDEAVKLRAMLEEAWCYISDPDLSIAIGTYLDGGDE